MAIQGLRDTSNFVTNQRPENWREGILLLNPNGDAPLTALTSLMKSESTDDPTFHWWEKQLNDRRCALAENLTTTNTTINVTSGAQALKQGDILLVEQTREMMRVAQDPASDVQIVVTRGVAGTTATAVDYDGAAINPNLLVIGSSFEEGSDAPSGVNFDPTEVYNRCQIFRSTLEITRTASKTRLRTGDAVKEAKRECLEYFSIDMERAFWHGSRGTGTINGKPARYTGGVYWYLSQFAPASNIWANAGTAVSMATLEAKMEYVFRKGSSEKMVFCGNLVLLAIQQILRKNAAWQFTSGIKEYGMDVSRLVCPFGTLVFKTHPLFNQAVGGTNAGSNAYLGQNSTAVIMDMKNVRYRYVDDVTYQPDLQRNGLDGMKSGYIAECGLQLEHAETHHWWSGITSGVADS